MHLRSRAALAGAAVFALLLSGCGTSGTTPSSGTPSDTPSSTPSGDVSILSWRLADPGALGQLHQKWIDTFNSSQDEIKVTGEAIPYADKGTKLVNSVLSGTAPDIVAITTSELPDYVEYLQPVDKYWEAEGAEFSSAFTDSAKALATWDGQTWGIPMEDGTSDALYYNKDVLAAAGVDPAEATKSWEAYRAALEKIKAAGFTPMVLQGKDAASFERHWAWYVAGGADLSDPEKYVSEMCSPQAHTTFSWLTGLYTDGGLVPNPSGIGYDELTRQFAVGDVGFATDGPWGMGIFDGNNPGVAEKLAVTQMPPMTEGGTTGANEDALILVIPKVAKNPDAAWEFMKYMSSDEAQAGSAEAGSFVPTRKAVFDSPAVKDNALLTQFAAAIDKGGFVRPRSSSMAEMRQILITAFQAAVTGQSSPDDALNSACAQLDRL